MENRSRRKKSLLQKIFGKQLLLFIILGIFLFAAIMTLVGRGIWKKSKDDRGEQYAEPVTVSCNQPVGKVFLVDLDEEFKECDHTCIYHYWTQPGMEITFYDSHGHAFVLYGTGVGTSWKNGIAPGYGDTFTFEADKKAKLE